MIKRLFSSKKDKKKEAKPPQKATRKRKAKSSLRKSTKRQRGADPLQRRGAFDALFLFDLMQKECDREVDPSAAVFLEGVLNYLGTEIVELSYNRAKERSKGGFCIITPDDIFVAVENDEELRQMIKFKQSSKMQIRRPSII